MSDPSRRSLRPGLAVLAALLLGLAPAAALAAGPPLSLDEALRRAAAADPATTAWDARVAAAEARVRQAGVRPNPSLDLEVENFTGSGPYARLGRAETTLSYQQTLERGGKRLAREGVARASGEAQRRKRETARLDLLRDVQAAYAEALAAEAALVVAEARWAANTEALEDVSRRVKSARDPLFAGSRAEALAAQAEIDRDQARAAALNARQVLARFWGGEADFSLQAEPFFAVAAPAPGAAVASADLAVLEAERDAAQARVRLERAQQSPDPTLRAGVRYLGDSSDVAVVVGGSIPLRVFDSNRAGVEQALAERTAAEADIAVERIVREREIARLQAQMTAAARESERIRTEVIPAAIRAVAQVTEGFKRGGFQHVSVAEAERGLAEARGRRVAVLRQFHLDQAALDRLTGRHAALASANLNVERR